jgi:nucleotide-binding universal stress UspA family protein
MGVVNFKKIMIATDGSDCSRLATDKGIELARLSGGTVYAVHVVSTAYLSPMDGDYFMGRTYALEVQNQQQ